MHNNKAIVIQFQAEMGKKLQGESVALGDYFTDDAQWHLPASLDTYIHGADRIGKAAVLDLLDTAVKRCYKPETMRFDFHSMISDKDYVHQNFTMSAETASGKAYKSGYQTLFKLCDGKISEVWEYFDSGLLISLIDNN
jgi:ketosteroid isomerase-like protein